MRFYKSKHIAVYNNLILLRYLITKPIKLRMTATHSRLLELKSFTFVCIVHTEITFTQQTNEVLLLKIFDFWHAC